MKNCRGAGLIDIIISLVLVAASGLILSATIPTGLSSLKQAQETKQATNFAQTKIEQVKSIGYESLSYSNLEGRYVDGQTTSGSFTFTTIDKLATVLPSPEGLLDISDIGGGVKHITATVRWRNSSGVLRSVALTTRIADKRPKKG